MAADSCPNSAETILASTTKRRLLNWDFLELWVAADSCANSAETILASTTKRRLHNWDFLELWVAVDSLSLIKISEPTRLGMIMYAVFCLKKKRHKNAVVC